MNIQSYLAFFLLIDWLIDFFYPYLRTFFSLHLETERHRCERQTLIDPPHTRPDWRSNPQPRDVPWPGVESTTFQSTGQHSNQLSYQARAYLAFLWPGPTSAQCPARIGCTFSVLFTGKVATRWQATKAPGPMSTVLWPAKSPSCLTVTANDSDSLELPPQGPCRGQELNTNQEQSTWAPGPWSVTDGAAGGAAAEGTAPMCQLSWWRVTDMLSFTQTDLHSQLTTFLDAL